jgi:hypothetical protein
LGTSLSAQYIEVSDSMYDAKLQKTIRAQRTWGTVLLVTGIGIFTATAVSATKNIGPLFGPPKEKKSHLLPILLGISSIAASVTLLHEAASNKRVARDISAYMKIEELPIANTRRIIKNYPVVGIKISI